MLDNFIAILLMVFVASLTLFMFGVPLDGIVWLPTALLVAFVCYVGYYFLKG